MKAENLRSAWQLLEEAYQCQMAKDFNMAIKLYQRSIDLHPTAEAYTFLGWTYHFQGREDDAIAECKKAIRIDPDFGNPYNDIGSYLIEKGKFDEALPWLERAIQSRRYNSYHFPYHNMGRIFVAQELYKKARSCFEKALKLFPGYTPSQEALEQLKRKLQ